VVKLDPLNTVFGHRTGGSVIPRIHNPLNSLLIQPWAVA